MTTAPVPPATPTGNSQPPHPSDSATTDKSRDVPVAFIGFTGAILATAIAFASGIWVANIAADSDQNISVTEYRREQVQDVYAATYALVETLEREELYSSPSFAIEDANNPPPRDLERLNRWNDSIHDLQDKYASLSLVASDKVIHTAADLIVVHRAIGITRDIASTTARELTTEIQPHNYVEFGKPLKSQDVRGTDDLDGLAYHLSRQLVSETREDLDIN